MAFDYGSIDLGLKNPFKKQGTVTAIRGFIQTLLGLYLLVKAAGVVKEDVGQGWILVIFGIILLVGGLRALGGGIYATMRYFVGRNHPTSLAPNFSKSEKSTAQEELGYVAYRANDLEEMLVGRKNSTFIEPQGFLARLLHTFVPKLLFMPYPIRNITQTLFAAWVKTLVALIAYGFVAFVSLAGFAGEVGNQVFPIYSVLLVLYLLKVWRNASKPIARKAERGINSLGSADLIKVIVFSLLLPVVLGVVISWLTASINLNSAKLATVSQWLSSWPSFHSGYYLFAIFVLAIFSSALIWFMLKLRLKQVTPLVEVSELRENWQESVHPNEIFINLDNLVMANRRYKEVPNRVYRELEPKLNEQVDGKGEFKGEMIQEIQPKVRDMNLGKSFDLARLLALVSGNVFYLVAIILTLLLAFSVVDIYQFIKASPIASLKESMSEKYFTDIVNLVMVAVHLLLVGYLFKSFGQLLANVAKLFFAEIQFESLLVYFKCEGTFTESKISTGTSIHDSTRSENTLVRSSITPWVIASRIVSSTFADTGMKNLEHARVILEMHKADDQLYAIKNDLISFLKDRESIASITSERDLGNASQIHQLNKQTRAIPTENLLQQDEEAAGYLREEQARKKAQDDKDNADS
jgi:hypothetical protein